MSSKFLTVPLFVLGLFFIGFFAGKTSFLQNINEKVVSFFDEKKEIKISISSDLLNFFQERDENIDINDFKITKSEPDLIMKSEFLLDRNPKSGSKIGYFSFINKKPLEIDFDSYEVKSFFNGETVISELTSLQLVALEKDSLILRDSLDPYVFVQFKFLRNIEEFSEGQILFSSPKIAQTQKNQADLNITTIDGKNIFQKIDNPDDLDQISLMNYPLKLELTIEKKSERTKIENFTKNISQIFDDNYGYDFVKNTEKSQESS